MEINSFGRELNRAELAAYNKGMCAARSGISCEDNPYDDHGRTHAYRRQFFFAWRAGWIDAKRIHFPLPLPPEKIEKAIVVEVVKPKPDDGNRWMEITDRGFFYLVENYKMNVHATANIREIVQVKEFRHGEKLVLREVNDGNTTRYFQNISSSLP